MRKFTLNLALITSFIIIILLSGCGDDNSVSPINKSKFDLGIQTILGNFNINNSKSTINVSGTGSKLDGLTLEIPANSFATSSSLEIKYSEIKSHILGANFNPITPLIQINTSKKTNDSVLKITIPINLPENKFAMAFLYDSQTGSIEGLPIVNLDSKSISVALANFKTNNSKSILNLKNNSIQSDNQTANIIVSMVDKYVLENSAEILTKFRPSTDDWEFINYGSYLAPGGHCAGQSISAMWYFYEKKLKGEVNLNKKYDLLSNNNFDNAKGYRFASVLQKDANWGSWLFQTWMKNVDLNPSIDFIKIYSFAYSMLLTNEPQFVCIWKEDGKNPDGSIKYAGHALVAYGINFKTGEVYIADPNHPSDEKRITFNNMKFNPYNGQANANTDPQSYNFISYHAKSAIINWDKITNRWNEFQNNTIGNISPHAFPLYQIKYNSDKNLTDNIELNKDTLIVNVESQNTDLNYTGTKNIGIDLYDINDNLLVSSEINGKSGVIKYVLKEGLNKIGFYVYGWKKGYAYKNGSEYPLFIDFKWLNINYKKPEPGAPLIAQVSPATGQENDLITITGSNLGTSGEVFIGTKTCYINSWNNSKIECKVPNLANGKYTLYVKSNNKTSNSMEFTIEKSYLSTLQKTISVSFLIGTRIIIAANGWDDDVVSISSNEGMVVFGNDKKPVILWNGTSFSLNYSFTTGSNYPIESSIYNGSISGSVSSDGTKIISCLMNEECTSINYDKSKSYRKQSGSISNLPLYNDGYSNIEYLVNGIIGQNYASGFGYEYVWWDEKGKELWRKSVKEIKWSETDKVRITFAKK
jgi:hypothetical protein